MFNLELYKTNKIYIITSIIFIALLTFLNIIIFKYNDNQTKLENEESSYNRLVINEIMTSNEGSFIDSQGDSYDWIELYNGTDQDINLNNYGLSDASDESVKWIFPEVTIEKGTYLIVYLSGEVKDGLYANFSLKKNGGEVLTLINSKGKIVDSVETILIDKNTSMSRDSKGKWIKTEDITPGYENTMEGREKFLSGFLNKNINSALMLSEFLPSNEGNVMFDGKPYSYVEVKNISDDTINLRDYYLSNNEKIIYKWRFPDVKLNSGDSYLVYMNSLNKDNNASFDLKHKSGVLILANYEGVIENIEYDELTNGLAYIKINDKWVQSSNISPGYSNDTLGKISFQQSLDIPKKDLVISEIMSSNNKFLAQNGNQFYDWIELYNNSDHDINLSNYSLTTNYDDKKMYTLPDVNLLPNEYYLIMASGNVSLSNDKYKHANFKLSSGTGLFLYNGEDLIDSLYIHNVPRESSYGRGIDNGHFYYSVPTPGEVNDLNGIRELAYDPIFSISGGIYNAVSSIEVSLEGTGDIYYTLDGSIPTSSSYLYTSPINLNKTTVIRAVSYESNKKNSNIVTNSYIINENHTIPVVSISLDSLSFNNIQANAWGHSSAPCHVELYEDNSFFSIDCDFKLFGNESRNWQKKSFALKFNYGHLFYKVFDYRDLYEFNDIVLRSGSQDQNNAMMRDEFETSIANKHGTLDAQAYKPVVLYINGNYWGVYYLREKIDSNFIENNYNVDGATNITNCNYFAEEGDNSDLIKLRTFVVTHDLSQNKNYEYVENLLDIENYIDLWVFQFIVNNSDFHNYRYYNNPNISNGKVRMILYDLDYSMRMNSGVDYLNQIQYPSGGLSFVDMSILRGLMKNQTFRKKFVQRISYYIKNVWNTENINAEFDSIYNKIKPEMARNCKRWNLSYDNWNNYALALKNRALRRIDEVIQITKDYFNLSQEEVNEYFY